jgi:hypothetical protein
MFADKEFLSNKKIFIFWVPLAATWLMMATEGPFLAAVIARLVDPKFNLAAFGVAYSFGILIEAPVIMLMSASTALVKNRDSYIKLRNFSLALIAICTLIMIIFVTPWVFYFIMQRLIRLPENIARLTHQASLLLIPWPGLIGYRRFYQGILIRSNLTRRVAYGTVIRLTTMVVVSLACYLFFPLSGAKIGTLTLSLAVFAEAIASRIMAHNSVKHLMSQQPNVQTGKPLNYKYITKFYYPLALTSVLGLGVHPMVTFFMGQSSMPIESLAVLPVINSLVFIFRSLGLAFQEVVIALSGKNNRYFVILRNFALFLGIGVVIGLSLITFTAISHIWFHKISGLSLELTRLARLPAQILSLLPGLTVLISFQRALLVKNEKTVPITIATSIEVIAILIILLITIAGLNLIGAIAAAIAMIIGRLCANTYLFIPCRKVLKKNL